MTCELESNIFIKIKSRITKITFAVGMLHEDNKLYAEINEVRGTLALIII